MYLVQCDWVVQVISVGDDSSAAAALRWFVEVAEEEKCDIYLGNFNIWRLSDKGCHIFPIILRADHKIGIKRCIDRLSKRLKFLGVNDLSVEEFEKYEHSTMFDAIGQSEFVMTVLEYHEANRDSGCV